MSALLAADAATTSLGYWTEVGYAALGVGLSVLMPFLAALVKKYWPGETTIANWRGFWVAVRPYVILGAFSLVIAILVAASADFETRSLALLAGFAWDKTLQVSKLTTTN